MRKLLVLSVILTAAASAKPKFPETEELLKTLKMDVQQKRTIDNMVDSQIANNPDLKLVEKEYRSLMNKTVGWAAIKDDVINIWETKFTQPEIVEITKFYKTPTGKKTLDVLPEITTEGMQIGMRKMQSSQAELMKVQQLLVERKQKQEKKK